MTLNEGINKVMVALGEVESSDLQMNIEDYQYQLPEIFDSIQRELALYSKPIVSFIEVQIENGCCNKPSNIINTIGAYTVSGEEVKYREFNNKIYIDKDGNYLLKCSVYPSKINADTNKDTYEFEIDKDAQEAMIYGVCANLNINSGDAQAYQIFLNRYNICLQNIEDKLANETPVTFTGGVRL